MQEREQKEVPPPDIDKRGALSTREACIYLNVGLTTLYSEMNAGRLKLRKIGRKTVILKADAEAWLAALPTNLGPPVSVRAGTSTHKSGHLMAVTPDATHW